MTLSLGEVEAMARKAARGAGYAWGVADEAGYAVRWLEARQMGGILALAGVLDVVSKGSPADFAPSGLSNWSCPNERLCPVMTGLVLADAVRLRGQGALNLPPVMAPLLLLPFLGHAAATQSQPLSAMAGTGRAVVLGEDIEMAGEWAVPDCPVSIAPSETTPALCAMVTRADPDPLAWKILKRMASRTYAPATEASRLKGAGAGLTDND